MRIVIDCRWMTTDTGGIRRFLSGILSGLVKVEGGNRYFLLSDSEVSERLISGIVAGRPGFEIIKTGYGVFSIKNKLLLPGLLRRLGTEIFHSGSFTAPDYGGKRIISIYDIIPVIHPEYCRKSLKARLPGLFKKYLSYMAKKADAVITVSENSAKDIIDTLGIEKKKLINISAGIEERFRVEKDGSKQEKTRQNYSSGRKFILFSGRQEPSKNLAGLIMAYLIFIRKTGDRETVLLIAGKKDERYPEPYKIAAESGTLERIVFTGFVPDEELVRLYNAAEFFVFPSFYEGFGFPPLEAMACGCPVITSDRASIPEVVGDAAVKINPADTEALAEAMSRLFKDEKIREELSEKGIIQAQKFRWETVAEKLLEIYGVVKLDTECTSCESRNLQ